MQLLEWHDSWLGEGQYSILIEKVYTDPNGHFILNKALSPKYKYSLKIYKDLYFEDDFPLPLPRNNVNLLKFPFGYIKTHVVNKIEKARWISLYFFPYYNSQPLNVYGLINSQIFTQAFSDTTFITTSVGGVTNNLRILVNETDYVPDEHIVKDTSFLTLKHDTVHINIILK